MTLSFRFLEDKAAAAFTHLAVFAVLHVLLPVEEPVWDFVLARILHDGHHTLDLTTKQLRLLRKETEYGDRQERI